eukprot:5341706-Pleurochrysis_carterae.AAC.3
MPRYFKAYHFCLLRNLLMVTAVHIAATGGTSACSARRCRSRLLAASSLAYLRTSNGGHGTLPPPAFLPCIFFDRNFFRRLGNVTPIPLPALAASLTLSELCRAPLRNNVKAIRTHAASGPAPNTNTFTLYTICTEQENLVFAL